MNVQSKNTLGCSTKKLVDKAPEIRRQLENMIQISDMAIPENWKEIVNQLGH